MSNVYDVIIVGGGPIGLSTAYECLKKQQNVLVIEKFSFHNDYGSSPGFSRQFRISYSEEHLCELASLTSPLWDQLMTEMNNDKLLHRTGCLWFGDSTISTSEGNINEAIKNLDKLNLSYNHYIGADPIKTEFPFVGDAVNGIDKPEALYMEDGGTVNVPALIQSYLTSFQGNAKITLLEATVVTKIDYSQADKIIVTANPDSQEFQGTKLIMTPGAYVNETLATLSPSLTQQIKFKIYLWVSTYYNIKPDTTEQPKTWPIWYFFGQPFDTSPGGSTDLNAYYGFPSDDDDQPGKARVCPAFTSKEEFDFEYYPPSANQRPLDEDAIEFTKSFVQRSMPSLVNNPADNKSSCIAGFAEMTDGTADESAGFVLDFLPGTANRIVIVAGGWAMKYVPVMGIIAADLGVDGQTTPDYARLIAPMAITRGIMEDIDQGSAAPPTTRPKLTPVQRAAQFRNIIG